MIVRVKNFASVNKPIMVNFLINSVFLVDECSMISSRMFQMIYNVCETKNPNINCGGIQLIFVGDFYQLPPVPNKDYDDEGKFCFESEDFSSVFPHSIVLKSIIRQKEEQLKKAVNNIYKGNLTQETHQLMEGLSRPLPPDPNSLKLFSKNEYVDDYNRSCILNFPGELHEFVARDTISNKESDFSSITAPRVLWLKKGCPVTLVRNLSDTLVNGLRGTVEAIDEDGPIVRFPSLNLVTRIPKVKFTGKIKRSLFS